MRVYLRSINATDFMAPLSHAFTDWVPTVFGVVKRPHIRHARFLLMLSAFPMML